MYFNKSSRDSASLKSENSLKLSLLFSVTELCRFFVSPQTVALQAFLSMEFSTQEYWNGLPFPSPGDLLDPGIEPASPALTGKFVATEPLGELLS